MQDRLSLNYEFSDVENIKIISLNPVNEPQNHWMLLSSVLSASPERISLLYILILSYNLPSSHSKISYQILLCISSTLVFIIRYKNNIRTRV
jgi:hypothetical protein